MKTFYIIALSALLITTFSCDELIEADAPNNQISATQVYADTQTAYSALSGLYINLRKQSLLSGNNYGLGALLGSYTDDLDCYFTDQNGYLDLYNNRLQPTNIVVETIWNNTYQQIYAANAIIDGVKNSNAITVEDKQQISGEALLIRSLLYFYLQRIFDQAPYTTSLDYEYNRHLTKLGKEEMLATLEADLKEASGLLSDSYRDPERIYPNRKVAELLLAQIYLLEGNYLLAEQTALGILQSNFYTFQPDITEVFHKDAAHILWQIKPQYTGDSTQEAAFYYFSEGPPMAYALTEDLVNSFAPGDSRRISWI